MMRLVKIHLFILVFIPLMALAQCDIYKDEEKLKQSSNDLLQVILSTAPQCPKSIMEFKALLNQHSSANHTYMVANEGRYNPANGSFSLFESYSTYLGDELYLGHFTTLDKGEIILDQTPDDNKLLIEVISWDKDKQYYNFYELRGWQNNYTRWFYRGNTIDAHLDNQYLFRTTPTNKAKFGDRMRCSACHNNGGPILKELSPPHNDWWLFNRPLTFGDNVLSSELESAITYLESAGQLASAVKGSIEKLASSPKVSKFKNTLSMQEKLRPLFCGSEINLVSAETGIHSSKTEISIPSEFWLHPLVDNLTVSLSKKSYLRLLYNNQMQLADTNEMDADNAWLSPAPAMVDISSIQALIDDKIITTNFAKSVLLYDIANPTLSVKRCQLLKLVPSSQKHWRQHFLAKLEKVGTEESKQLYRFIYYPDDSVNEKKAVVRDYKKNIRTKIKDKNFQQQSFEKLMALRDRVQESELSQNPLGQILEPEFRVIFPIPYNASNKVSN